MPNVGGAKVDKCVKADPADKFTGYSVKLKKKVTIKDAKVCVSKTSTGNWRAKVVGNDGQGTAVHAFIGFNDPKVKRYHSKLGV